MAKVFLPFFFFLFQLTAAAATSHAPVPAPAPMPETDCTDLVLSMVSCVSYIRVGGRDTKPEQSCCVGLKKVIKTDADCFCAALTIGSDAGIDINATRAQALPLQCAIKSSFNLTHCSNYGAPSPSPSPSPVEGSAPSSSPSISPAPAVKPPSISPSPAKAPSIPSSPAMSPEWAPGNDQTINESPAAQKNFAEDIYSLPGPVYIMFAIVIALLV